MSNPITQQLNDYLAQYHVVVKFLDPVLDEDLPGYDRGQINDIFGAIMKRFERNGKPHKVTADWILNKSLFGYFKIRLLPQMIRIVYKIEELSDHTVATIVVVGPKKREEAYKIARQRIAKFFE